MGPTWGIDLTTHHTLSGRSTTDNISLLQEDLVSGFSVLDFNEKQNNPPTPTPPKPKNQKQTLPK